MSTLWTIKTTHIHYLVNWHHPSSLKSLYTPSTLECSNSPLNISQSNRHWNMNLWVFFQSFHFRVQVSPIIQYNSDRLSINGFWRIRYSAILCNRVLYSGFDEPASLEFKSSSPRPKILSTTWWIYTSDDCTTPLDDSLATGKLFLCYIPCVGWHQPL